jgi:hypothetical protein
MRLRISTSDGQTVSRLASVALLNIYESDDADRRIELYRNHLGTYLHHVVENNVTPAANQLQELLSTMASKDKVLYLYISAWAGNEPTHYMVLHKHANDGLWRVSCRRILECKVGKPPKKDGILITWLSPYPDVAAGLKPRIKRIFSGSVNIQSLASDVFTKEDLKWEMHLSYLTTALFSSKPEFSVWMRPTGKAVFRVVEDKSEPSNTDTRTVYTQPYQFECMRTRPYAKNISRPRCIVWASNDIPEEFFDDGLHIVPQIKGAEQITFDESNKELSSLLDMGLSARLFPYIGVQEHKRVCVYGLSYNPETTHVETVILADNRLPERCAGIPLILPMPNNRYLPNYVLLDILLYHLFLFDVDDRDRAEVMRVRWEGLKELMVGLSGVSSTRKYPEVFAKWGVPLNAGQLEKLATYAVRFP